MKEAQKFIKKNKKIIMITIIMLGVLFVLVMLIPVLLNFFVMSWSTAYTFGSENTWLSLWGSLISAVLGGIISGGLTLGGVVLTIKHKEKKDFLDNHPIKITKLDDVQTEVLDFLRLVNKYTKDRNNKEFNAKKYFTELKSLLELRRKRFSDVMRISSEVDLTLYNEIKIKFVMNLEILYMQLDKKVDTSELNLEDIGQGLSQCFDAIMDARIKLATEYSKIKS